MSNVGFYPTTELNPYTTTIGSQGNYQSIMSYIYGASVYEMINTTSATSTIDSPEYSGLTLSFTPLNSTNIMIQYNIYSGLNSATAALWMSLYIDDVPPPAVGGTIPTTAIAIDNSQINLDIYRSQTLVIMNGIVYGGGSSGNTYTITLNTKYYISWYMASQTAGSVASLYVYGMSIQSI